jgi:chorismate mutase
MRRGAMTPGDRLAALRRRIDRLDRRIFPLLARRHGLVLEVGRVKRRAGMPVEDPRREGEIGLRLARAGFGDGAKRYIGAVYRAIFESSKDAEREE